MGKTYKEKPDKWRHKIKHNKPGKFNKGGKPRHDDNGDKKGYGPFDDSQGYHESFVG